VNELDEETALSVIFANTKRKKRSEDLLTIARCIDYLVNLYGSQDKVAERVGLHSEMIRQFKTLLKLPAEVQNLIADREIDKLDVAYRIAMIKDPSKQTDVARAVADLHQSKDIRDVIRLVTKAGYSAEESKKKITEAKPQGLHIFVMDFDDKAYMAINQEAKRMDVSPAQLVKQIVEEWLDSQGAKTGGK
jgi:hypothetical protein